MYRYAWVLLAASMATPALADHIPGHECNYSIPGYTPNRFVDNGDGTISDRRTGLVWQRCPLGDDYDPGTGQCTTVDTAGARKTWQQALQAAADLNVDGSTPADQQWRLPNLKELASLINHHCHDPAAFSASLPAFANHTSYWTSTPFLFSVVPYDTTVTNQAWLVNFSAGKADHKSIRLPSPVLLVKTSRGESQ